MTEYDPVYVNIPCPTPEEATKLCEAMLLQDLCGTAKINKNVSLLWKEDDVRNEDVCLITLKTTKGKLDEIHQFILKNHSWVTPCIEVVSIISDMC